MTTIWIEVCDSLGACTQSEEMLVPVAFAGISPEKLAEAALGHLKRCELMELERLFMTSLLSLKVIFINILVYYFHYNSLCC